MTISRLSQKKLEKLEKRGKLRDSFELWVDKHNHKFELVRTFTSVVGLIISSIILWKIFTN
jgi:hypothetical protein